MTHLLQDVVGGAYVVLLIVMFVFAWWNDKRRGEGACVQVRGSVRHARDSAHPSTKVKVTR